MLLTSRLPNLPQQVNIKYPSGAKKFGIATPWRKKAVKGLTRRSYPSMATALVTSQPGIKPVIYSFARQIKLEIQGLCSEEHDTVLRNSKEAVKFFSWERIWLELKHNVPTLMTLLTLLVKCPENNKPLICFIISVILKQRSAKLGLVQRAISILLYGNGTSKQVGNVKCAISNFTAVMTSISVFYV